MLNYPGAVKVPVYERRPGFFRPLAVLLIYECTVSPLGLLFAMVLLVILFGTVFAAHAEVIAHRIGEPYGTLLLTLSVTIIEVSLIATIMLGEQEVPMLAIPSSPWS